MIPLGQLAAELVLAVGGALFVANVWVLLRLLIQRRSGQQAPRPASMTRVYVNLGVGAVASTWAIATLITRR